MILLLWMINFVSASPVSLEIGVEHRSVPHPFLNIEYQLPNSYLFLQSDHLTWYKNKMNDDIQTWIALMGQGYRTQQTLQKFEEGQLDLSQSFQTSYLGFHLGQLRTGRRNIQFGGRMHTGYYWFGDYGKNVEEQEPQIRSDIDTLFQWYQQGHLITSYLGSTFVFTNDLDQYPHARFRWAYFGSKTFEPIWGLVMGTAQDPDDLALTRIGGEKANFIPLMGADWGEFWVKDYIIPRLGARYEGHIKNFQYQLGLRTDFAWLNTPKDDAGWKIGTGLVNTLHWKAWSLNSHVGYGFWKETSLPSLSISLGWDPGMAFQF